MFEMELDELYWSQDWGGELDIIVTGMNVAADIPGFVVGSREVVVKTYPGWLMRVREHDLKIVAKDLDQTFKSRLHGDGEMKPGKIIPDQSCVCLVPSEILDAARQHKLGMVRNPG